MRSWRRAHGAAPDQEHIVGRVGTLHARRLVWARPCGGAECGVWGESARGAAGVFCDTRMFASWPRARSLSAAHTRTDTRQVCWRRAHAGPGPVRVGSGGKNLVNTAQRLMELVVLFGLDYFQFLFKAI